MSIGQERLQRRMARGVEFLGSETAILCGAMSWVSERNLVSAISNGEEVLVGTTNLQVGTTDPTPTATVPPATGGGKVEDDSCAISPSGGSSNGIVLLLLAPVLFALRRSWERC